jgi:hypothetical protein
MLRFLHEFKVLKVISNSKPSEIDLGLLGKFTDIIETYDDLTAEYLYRESEKVDNELYITELSWNFKGDMYTIYVVECWPGDQPKCFIIFCDELIFELNDMCDALEPNSTLNDEIILNLMERRLELEYLFHVN